MTPHVSLIPGAAEEHRHDEGKRDAHAGTNVFDQQNDGQQGTLVETQLFEVSLKNRLHRFEVGTTGI